MTDSQFNILNTQLERLILWLKCVAYLLAFLTGLIAFSVIFS